MLQSSSGTLQLTRRLASPTWAPCRVRANPITLRDGGGAAFPFEGHQAARRASRAASVEAPGVLRKAHSGAGGIAPPTPTFRAWGGGAPRRPGEPAERYAEPLCGGLPACTRSECIP